jgi:hypothetical protein
MGCALLGTAMNYGKVDQQFDRRSFARNHSSLLSAYVALYSTFGTRTTRAIGTCPAYLSFCFIIPANMIKRHTMSDQSALAARRKIGLYENEKNYMVTGTF